MHLINYKLLISTALIVLAVIGAVGYYLNNSTTVNISTSSAIPSAIPSASAQPVQPKIVLRNGTKTVGLAVKTEAELKKSLPDLNVITKENADKDYKNSLVVVLNDFGKDVAQNLAKVLNASASALPSGESKPEEGDILILLGKDRT